MAHKTIEPRHKQMMPYDEVTYKRTCQDRGWPFYADKLQLEMITSEIELIYAV